MSQDSKAEAPQTKAGGGLLRRVFGRGERETSGSDAHSGQLRGAHST